jgi:hypothetical protein
VGDDRLHRERPGPALPGRKPALIEVKVGLMPDPFPFFNGLGRMRG